MRASVQLSTAIEILSDREKRQSYLAGWFPGLRSRESGDLDIKACVLCSDRTFSGLEYRGLPVRDFSSISLLFGDGVISLGSVDEENRLIKKRFRIYADGGPTALDLDNYLSSNPKYLSIYAPFMRPITRLEYLDNGATIVGFETFVLTVEDISEWCGHLESLGFQRLPDEELDIRNHGDTWPTKTENS